MCISPDSPWNVIQVQNRSALVERDDVVTASDPRLTLRYPGALWDLAGGVSLAMPLSVAVLAWAAIEVDRSVNAIGLVGLGRHEIQVGRVLAILPEPSSEGSRIAAATGLGFALTPASLAVQAPIPGLVERPPLATPSLSMSTLWGGRAIWADVGSAGAEVHARGP